LFVVKDSADGIRPLDGEDEVKGNPYLGDEEAEDIEAQEGTAAAENEALASSVLETSIIPHVCFFIDHEDHILVARAHTKENQGRFTRSSDIAELGAAVLNALSGENSTSPTESAPVQASQHFHRRLNRSRIHLGNTSKACVSAFIASVLKVKVSALPVDPKTSSPALTELEESQAPPDAEDALAVSFVAKRIMFMSRNEIEEQRILFSPHLPGPVVFENEEEESKEELLEGEAAEGKTNEQEKAASSSSSSFKSPREIAEEHAATLRRMSSDIDLALPSSIVERFTELWNKVRKTVDLKDKQRSEEIESENATRTIELMKREEELAAAAAATAAIEKAEAAAARSRAKRAEAAKISEYMRSGVGTGAGGRRGSRLGSAMALQAALAAADFDMEAILEAAAKHAADTGVSDVALREALILDRRTQTIRNKLVSSNLIKNLTSGLVESSLAAKEARSEEEVEDHHNHHSSSINMTQALEEVQRAVKLQLGR
jgi:hypothetical protein